MKSPVRIAAAVAVLAFALDVRGDETAAAAMFDRGLAAMTAGQYDVGCPMLAESFRLDPRAGSLFTLAECEAKQGKTASAFVHYQEFLVRWGALSAREQARQSERRDLASKQVEALRSQLSALTIEVPADAPDTLVVRRDGEVQGKPSLNVSLPIDPGEHVVTAERGGQTREVRIKLAPGETKHVAVEVPPAPVERAPVPPAAAPPPREDAERPSRWPVVAAFGVGAAAVVAGATFGGLTWSKKSTIDAHCPAHRCDPEGRRAVDSAATTGLVSTISFGVGAASLIFGTTLLLLEPGSQKTATLSVQSTRDGAGFTLERSW